ncbi:S41 family peptidase [Streptomyces abikoensis]|uniref:S41 family peptidase n=1 Tax=Streptomyces abikoensis TaxID=97398 RepID=UPI00368AACE4
MIKSVSLALLASSVVLTATPTATARPTASLDGVWRTDGYGTVVSVENGGRLLRAYETTSVGCLPGEVTALGEATATIAPDGPGRARLSYASSVGHRVLRRIPALPDACRAPRPAKDPRAVFDVFWQTYAENYPFFAMKHIDWRAVRDHYRPMVTDRTTDQELFGILRAMIEPLHDGHTYLVKGEGPEDRFGGHREDTPFPTGELIRRIDTSIAHSVGEDRLQRWGKGRISFAELPDGIGYLRLTGFLNYTDDETFAADRAELDRALDAVLTRERTTGPKALRGLVLDLRFNGGGSDRLGLHVAERLTDRPYTAYLKQARDDAKDPRKFTPAEPVRVLPHRGGPVYTGPLAVLTGRLTISAGETTTQALMGRPSRPTRIGANTNGSFSDVMERRLPNGWTFGLPNEEFRDPRTGVSYDGDGIAPDVRTPVFTDDELASGRDSALAEARARLTSN